MILDGWGIPENPEVSAIDKAHTPFIDSLYNDCPNAKLHTSGMDVGLPDGQMGNSEVGHMNIGAGRVVYQDLARIHLSIEQGDFFENPVLNQAFDYLKSHSNKKLHLIGLVSDGGVHSHIRHLIALMKKAHQEGVSKTYVHAFTDGRDTDPKGALYYMKEVAEAADLYHCHLASIIGRYYAMDRDKRWERVKLAYDLLTQGKGEKHGSAQKALSQSYEAGITDEFIKPVVLPDFEPIEEGDVVICFNFRTDRGRQITQALTQQAFPEYAMKPLDLHYLTMARYDDTFKKVEVMFEKDNLNNTLGEVLAKHGKTQIRIAETEKYPHVTFFFSGGREEAFEGEKRILCPSPKVATYDLKPEMSAFDIRDAIIPELEAKSADFICLNFANPDMVGHTGVMQAAVKACETVDTCARDVAHAALENDYAIIIIADHGNADCMINPDGTPNTAHTTTPVPIFLLDKNKNFSLKEGRLADIAPTVLELIGIDKPAEMTGEPLIQKK